MAKEPYKDPFPNLPRRVCGVVPDDAVGKEVKAAVKRAEDRSWRKQLDAEIEAIREKKATKRGPKKGEGGRPKKAAGVSKRTAQRRAKAAK